MRLHVPIPLLEDKDKIRFLRKVRKIEGNGCWEWQGCEYFKGGGYGGFAINGRPIRAHRMAWIVEYGIIPDNKCVLHKCDNPKCCRPDHLFLGTHKDNMKDCADKGRNILQKCPEKAARGDAHYSRTRPHLLKRGEQNKNSKIMSTDVIEIRHKYFDLGIKSERLALEYPISARSIRDILNKTTWAHIQ